MLLQMQLAEEPLREEPVAGQGGEPFAIEAAMLAGLGIAL
jgi:hypothetical protein